MFCNLTQLIFHKLYMRASCNLVTQPHRTLYNPSHPTFYTYFHLNRYTLTSFKFLQPTVIQSFTTYPHLTFYSSVSYIPLQHSLIQPFITYPTVDHLTNYSPISCNLIQPNLNHKVDSNANHKHNPNLLQSNLI